MATANALAAVEGGARQIECTINGLGERAGNTALEEVVMALRVRNDIMPYATGIDTTKIMGVSRKVAQVSGFAVQFNKAIVGKNAFAHESGIHQDGMLKNAETFEIMRPADIGLTATNLVMGKHSGRAALRAKLRDLGYDLADNQMGDVFVRFKALADRKKEVFDDDLVALVTDTAVNTEADHLQLKRLRVICGTDGPQEAELTLHLKHPSGLEVLRRITFEYGKPLFTVRTQLRAPPFEDRNLKYAVTWGPGIGGADTAGPNYISFSGPTTFVNNERVENPADDMQNTVTHKGDLVWTGFQNKYFAAALIPENGVGSAFVQKIDDDTQYVGLNFESVQSAATATYQVYVGTKELELLESLNHKLFRLIDYGWFGNKFAFLVKPILKCLNFFYDWLGNYGWSIIMLTFVIKLIFFPLTHKSFKSMKGMQKIQPYVKVLQERYKDDRQKMNEEMISLYRQHKVNPLGGCLPMLLQIPVFIALYHALFFSIELRGAPFMLWIEDLSKSDPYFVTPVLMGATMYLQQKLTPTVADPIQQKIFLMMPIVFTFLFITFPAGLVIYWTVNNILTIAQQYYIYHVAKD